eukprot:135736_1
MNMEQDSATNKASKSIQQQTESAIKIQSHFRGHLARTMKPNDTESNSLLHTLCTTNPKHYYTLEEREAFEQAETDSNNQQIKLKQQQKQQLITQQQSAIIIHQTHATPAQPNATITPKEIKQSKSAKIRSKYTTECVNSERKKSKHYAWMDIQKTDSIRYLIWFNNIKQTKTTNSHDGTHPMK